MDYGDEGSECECEESSSLTVFVEGSVTYRL